MTGDGLFPTQDPQGHLFLCSSHKAWDASTQKYRFFWSPLDSGIFLHSRHCKFEVNFISISSYFEWISAILLISMFVMSVCKSLFEYVGWISRKNQINRKKGTGKETGISALSARMNSKSISRRPYRPHCKALYTQHIQLTAEARLLWSLCFVVEPARRNKQNIHFSWRTSFSKFPCFEMAVGKNKVTNLFL